VNNKKTLGNDGFKIRGQRAFKDKFGNIWKPGPSRTAGQSFE